MRAPTGGGAGRGAAPPPARWAARVGATAWTTTTTLLLAALLLLLQQAGPANAQSAATPLSTWAQKLGGQNGDDVVRALATDAQGSTYVAGDFRSASITIGGKRLGNTGTGKTDVFVVRRSQGGWGGWWCLCLADDKL